MAIAAPAVVFVGCWPKTNWLTAAGVMAKLLDAGPVMPRLPVSLRV